MQLLLDGRPDLDSVDGTGRTPLHLAAEAEQLREAMLLIGAGARVDIRKVLCVCVRLSVCVFV